MTTVHSYILLYYAPGLEMLLIFAFWARCFFKEVDINASSLLDFGAREPDFRRINVDLNARMQKPGLPKSGNGRVVLKKS